MNVGRGVAHPNVALVKYWGKSNTEFNIPASPSLSIALANLRTETEINRASSDQLEINGELTQDRKVSNWLARIRNEVDLPPVSVKSTSNFPANAGLASSAAGFAALTEAVCDLLNLDWDIEQKSTWARLGSASAARSVTGAWSELVPDEISSNETPVCKAKRMHVADYWDLRVVVAITANAPKTFSSTEGMELARKTSPYYDSWIESTKEDFIVAKEAVNDKNFAALADVSDSSSRKMHALMLSTNPPMLYWNSVTLGCIQVVQELQKEHLSVFCTIDAGPQLKAVCTADTSDRVASELAKTPGVLRVIKSTIGGGSK